MLIHSNQLGPKFKRQIFQKKLETGQPQDNSLAKSQRVEKRLLRMKRLLKALRASGKGTAKRWLIRASRGNRMSSPLWRTLSKEEDRGPPQGAGTVARGAQAREMSGKLLPYKAFLHKGTK